MDIIEGYEGRSLEAFQIWFVINESSGEGSDGISSEAILSAAAETMRMFGERAYSDSLFHIHVLRRVDGRWWCSPTLGIEDLSGTDRDDASDVLIPLIRDVCDAVVFAKESAMQHGRMLMPRLRKCCSRVDKPWVITVSDRLTEDEHDRLGRMVEKDASKGWYGTTRFAFVLGDGDRDCDFTMSSHTFRLGDGMFQVFSTLRSDMHRDDDMPTPDIYFERSPEPILK